ncbi:hypothetical protein SBBP2_110010 [Burkholderiales bacterium]|nr:hypothetical protein SBBP2_110010 [Burkholderiales bacterium]
MASWDYHGSLPGAIVCTVFLAGLPRGFAGLPGFVVKRQGGKSGRVTNGTKRIELKPPVCNRQSESSRCAVGIF